ncbi:MAG: threonine ammonia-lyase [Actinomycetia bacterium]|nr:threonine ammonia-lyase [Actinomycetes bacterium]
MDVTLTDIEDAAQALEGVSAPTPLLVADDLGPDVPSPLYLKLENLQRTGSFKLRGAYNRLRVLSAEERRRGVVAASAGNHAQGVALAAQLVGTSAVVVMPRVASMAKIAATERLGATVVLAGDDFDGARAHAEALAAETGRLLVPAFDDPRVVAGQGTVALEMLDARPDLDVIVVPVGGGGLAAGVAIAAKGRNPRIRVVGVQAARVPGMIRSRAAGGPVEVAAAETIADGIAVRRPGTLTYELVERYVDDLVAVDEAELARTMLFALERLRLVVEGAGVAGLAAVFAGRVPVEAERVGVVVSGGNVDVGLLARLAEKGLVAEGRQLHLRTVVRDRPGQLSRVLAVVAAQQANVLAVEHERWHPGLDPADVEVRLVVETRDRTHADAVRAALAAAGLDVTVMA